MEETNGGFLDKTILNNTLDSTIRRYIITKNPFIAADSQTTNKREYKLKSQRSTKITF